MSKQKITESEIISDIRRVARLIEHSPSSVEYKRYGRYDLRNVQRRFNLSWKKIIEAAGLRYTPRGCYRIPTTEELRNDLLRVTRLLGHPPSRTAYGNYGMFDTETVRRRSGKRKWEDAVAFLAGLDREEIKRYQRRGGKQYRTTAELLARLRAFYEKSGRAPTTAEVGRLGINAQDLRTRVGGNWEDVLKAARIDIRRRTKHATIRSLTTEALIDDVVAVSLRLGHPAKMREYKALGHYSYITLRSRLGGWNKVKRVVVEKLMNKRNSFELCLSQPRWAEKSL